VGCEKISSPTVNAKVGDESRRRILDRDEEMVVGWWAPKLALAVVFPRRRERRMVAGSSSSSSKGPISSVPLLDPDELRRLPLLSDRSMRADVGGGAGAACPRPRRRQAAADAADEPPKLLSCTRLCVGVLAASSLDPDDGLEEDRADGEAMAAAAAAVITPLPRSTAVLPPSMDTGPDPRLRTGMTWSQSIFHDLGSTEDSRRRGEVMLLVVDVVAAAR